MLIFELLIGLPILFLILNLPNIIGASERKEYERKEKQAIVRGEIDKAEYYRRMAGK